MIKKFIHNLCALIIFFSLSYAVWPQSLIFKNHGRLIKAVSLEELERLVGAETVTVFEPHELENRKYKGLPVNDVLTAVYGESWKGAEEILFTCSDGYQPSIPSVKFKAYDSYLAYASSDNDEFTLVNELQGNEPVQLGPFYLVWNNIKYTELKAEGGSDWPYQVTTIDLINFSDRFPNMAPPEKSSEEVKRGFLSFRKYCMTCHTVNGEGGGKSVELNYPVSVTEYIMEPWLVKWIDNPAGIRYNTTMPALNPDAKDRDRIIKNIIAYLKAMRGKKLEPVFKKR
ncbi:MAG TPA: c-type cytochrome [Thermodesulfobacteriota bacterium]|nr:c-type cytochrome [Thermodesulfobacteriota bacterium]